MAHRGRRRFVALTARLGESHPAIEWPEAVIEGGQVLVNGVIITKPTALVPADAAIRLRPPREPRGKLKLTTALNAFQVPTQGRVAVDVGASTGGFTWALLEAGVARVYAVDAGHGQLLGRLRTDPRVLNLERTNVAYLNQHVVGEPVDLISIDVSYLSLAKLAPQIEVLNIAPDADLVALVKPMYEMGVARPPTDEATLIKAVEMAVAGLETHGWDFRQSIRSPVLGGQGSVEYLVHLHRQWE